MDLWRRGKWRIYCGGNAIAIRNIKRNNTHQFWMHDNHTEEVNTLKFTIQKLNYIHLNSVRAGLVERAEDWLYSSARNYMYQPAVIDVDVMDFSNLHICSECWYRRIFLIVYPDLLFLLDDDLWPTIKDQHITCYTNIFAFEKHGR